MIGDLYNSKVAFLYFDGPRRAYIGGRRSGKTETALYTVDEEAKKNHPVVYYVVPTRPQGINAFDMLRQHYDLSGVPYKTSSGGENIFVHNKTIHMVVAGKSTSKPLWEAQYLYNSVVVVDESEYINQEILGELLRGNQKVTALFSTPRATGKVDENGRPVISLTHRFVRGEFGPVSVIRAPSTLSKDTMMSPAATHFKSEYLGAYSDEPV